MALGYKSSEADKIVKAQFRVAGYVAYSGPAAMYMQLHTADPGPTGVLAVANGGRRVAIGQWQLSGAGGEVNNIAEIRWVAVLTSQTYQRFSLHDAVGAGAGTMVCCGTLVGVGVAGQDFVISAGQASWSLLTAA